MEEASKEREAAIWWPSLPPAGDVWKSSTSFTTRGPRGLITPHLSDLTGIRDLLKLGCLGREKVKVGPFLYREI